jgi:hypothetical protein
MFDYDIKQKEHQNTRQSDYYLGVMPPCTNQIASCFDALSFTYNSRNNHDNGLFRCLQFYVNWLTCYPITTLR